jgi:hypothetical protein
MKIKKPAEASLLLNNVTYIKSYGARATEQDST